MITEILKIIKENPEITGIFVIVMLYLIIVIYNQIKLNIWIKFPDATGKIVQVKGENVFIRIQGNITNKNPLIILEPGAGMSSYFLWDLQEKIAEYAPVMVYDRKGLGWSKESKEQRLTKNLVNELRELLTSLQIDNKILLVGHSLGAVIGFEYIQTYTDDCKGIIQLDPVPLNNFRYKEEFTDKVYKNAIDKSGFTKYLKIIAKTQLLRVFAPIMTRSFPQKIRKNITNEFSRIGFYKSAINELLLVDESIKEAKSKARTVNKPLLLLAHDRKVHLEYYKQIGEETITEDECNKIEDIFEEGQREYSKYFYQSEIIQLEGTSHNMFMEKPEIIAEKIKNFYEFVRNK